MSIWTHVSGTIRLDSIRFNKEDTLTKRDFDKIFKVCTWHKWNKNCNMPLGSEGSIQYSLWTNPDLSHVASYQLTFRGDLRSYDNIDEIIEWWKSLTQKFKEIGHLMIREGVLEAHVEFDDKPTIMGFMDDKIYTIRDGKYEESTYDIF